MDSTGTETGSFWAFVDWLTWQRIVVIAAACAALVGIIVFVFVPLRYSATASILISETTPSAAGMQNLPVANLSLGGSAATRMEHVLKSRHMREILVDEHQLESRLGLSRGKTLKWLNEAASISVFGQRGLQSGIGLTVDVICPGPSRLQRWMGNPAPFTTDEAKQKCAELGNDYIAKLDEYMTTANVQSARDTRLFIEERLTEVQANLNETEDLLEELQTQYLLMEPDSKAKELISAAQDVNIEHARTARQAQELANSLSTSRSRLQREDAERISQEITQRNPMIVSLEERLARLQAELSTHLAEGKSSRHPDVVVAEAEIGDVKQQLSQVNEEVLQQIARQPNPLRDTLLEDVTLLEVQLAGIRARQNKLRQQMEEADSALRELPPIVREYVHMDRKRRIQAETLTSLTRQLELASIEEQRESSATFQVLDEAVPPERKSGPSTVRNAAITFVLLVILLSLMLAWRTGILAFPTEGIE
jgi:uncharacterized protein involved in exopolysaccharide biosynthesis